MDDPAELRGPIAWMARNHVAANLLMLFLIVGGLLAAANVRQEVFPEVELDLLTVTVTYPGASPEEVEEGIVLAVEEAMREIDEIEEIRSTAFEGFGSIVGELYQGADADQALNDLKSAVDRITSFPEDAERPVVSLASNRQEVISLVIHGDLDRATLDALAEQARRQLLDDPRISLVEIDGLPPPEISIEVPHAELRRYGLTLPEIAARVAAASVDLPGGGVRTEAGEVLVRTTERRDVGAEFARIELIASPDGTRVLLGDVATVVDGYRETDLEAYYDGEPAVRVRVFRLADQGPLEIADAVREWAAGHGNAWPESVGIRIVNDRSEIYQDRISLLIENGQLGALLVLVLLGLFLHPRLAFWVTLGIPVSFLGAFLFMPWLDVSINMISLFGFLVVLGIVVDDAIVVGEAVYKQRRDGLSSLEAAVTGTREVIAPVVFAVLTTVIAFTPLLFVPGTFGELFSQVPLIVIPILLLSLLEVIAILPAHLARVPRSTQKRSRTLTQPVVDAQARLAASLERWIAERYVPLVRSVVRRRYATLTVSLAALVLVAGLVAGGRIGFVFVPEVEGDTLYAGIEMPFGTPIEDTRRVVDRISDAAREVAADTEDATAGGRPLIESIYAVIGSDRIEGGPLAAGVEQTGAHRALVSVAIAPAGEREISGAEFARRWRERVGPVPGVERLAYTYNAGPNTGAAVAIRLSHQNTETLSSAADRLAAEIGDFTGTFDIDDGFEEGKTQFDLTLTPLGRSLGLNERDLATQVRGAFFGAEATRQQRGRDEVRVYVRLPRVERESLYYLENLILRTPAGGEVPLAEAAEITVGSAYTTIERVDGRRSVEVTADVDLSMADGGEITRALLDDVLPRMLADTPGLSYELSGEQEEQRDSLGTLGRGLLVALMAQFALMAVAFRSYLQPVVIMLAIPFGFIGAVLGHLLLGYPLSMPSLLGVVVNDSLVLVSAINDQRRAGASAEDAIVAGAARRFRPVVLTSLTTFVGLAPIILETSLQARFLVPMAVSLGFGVLFVTVIALAIVPAAYMVLEDLKRLALPAAGEASGQASGKAKA